LYPNLKIISMKKFFLTLSTISFLAIHISVGQIYIDTGVESNGIENTNNGTETKTTNTTINNTPNSIYVPVTNTTNTNVKGTNSSTTTVISPAKYETNENTSKPYEGKLSAVNDDLPTFAETGKCYARCFIPDQYEFYESQVLDKAASFKSQIIPATYETVFDTVVITPEKTKIEVVPAVYETVYEEIMVAPATTRWEKGSGDANCLSNDPKDCQVICLKEIPAQFNKVERKVVKTPSYTRQILC
jgi:hypothetical protein